MQLLTASCSQFQASNPGQFENDADLWWQRASGSGDSIFHHGRVGINTERPDEALTVHGNLRLTGSLLQPSDQRLKTILRPVDTWRSLKTLASVELVHFRYKPEIGARFDVDHRQERLGVLAQQLKSLLPDAVKECSLESDASWLMVDKDRLFMECVAAVQQLNLQQICLRKHVQRMQTQLLHNRIFSSFAMLAGSTILLAIGSLTWIYPY